MFPVVPLFIDICDVIVQQDGDQPGAGFLFLLFTFHLLLTLAVLFSFGCIFSLRKSEESFMSQRSRWFVSQQRPFYMDFGQYLLVFVSTLIFSLLCLFYSGVLPLPQQAFRIRLRVMYLEHISLVGGNDHGWVRPGSVKL